MTDAAVEKKPIFTEASGWLLWWIEDSSTSIICCERKNIYKYVRLVSSDKILSKAEVLETKRIASLRIHIERVIRRIRKFSILKPHSNIHHRTLDSIDDMITMTAALINLQDIIK